VTAATTFNQGLCLLAIGGTNYEGVIRNESTTTMRPIAANAAGTYLTVTQLTSTVPGTWAANDTITVSLTYEAA
jgi:hypothetical protein